MKRPWKNVAAPRGEHPDDRKSRKQGIDDGYQFAFGFAVEHYDRLVSLIGIYADDQAQEEFDKLREEFWSNDRRSQP